MNFIDYGDNHEEISSQFEINMTNFGYSGDMEEVFIEDGPCEDTDSFGLNRYESGILDSLLRNQIEQSSSNYSQDQPKKWQPFTISNDYFLSMRSSHYNEPFL